MKTIAERVFRPFMRNTAFIKIEQFDDITLSYNLQLEKQLRARLSLLNTIILDISRKRKVSGSIDVIREYIVSLLNDVVGRWPTLNNQINDQITWYCDEFLPKKVNVEDRDGRTWRIHAKKWGADWAKLFLNGKTKKLVEQLNQFKEQFDEQGLSVSQVRSICRALGSSGLLTTLITHFEVQIKNPLLLRSEQSE